MISSQTELEEALTKIEGYSIQIMYAKNKKERRVWEIKRRDIRKQVKEYAEKLQRSLQLWT